MIVLLALLLTQSAPAAQEAPPRIPVSVLRKDCLDGIGADGAAMRRCRDAMMDFARPFGQDDPEKSTCLGGVEHGPAGDLAWNWLRWLEDHPAPDEADAGASVAASILDRWPCGWSEG